MGLQHTLKALADPIRREILNLLKNGRLSAGEISDHFPVTAASISRHLSVLKEADLIRDTREGKYIYYDLNTTVLEEVMLWISDLNGEDDHEEDFVCKQVETVLIVHNNPDSPGDCLFHEGESLLFAARSAGDPLAVSAYHIC